MSAKAIARAAAKLWDILSLIELMDKAIDRAGRNAVLARIHEIEKD